MKCISLFGKSMFESYSEFYLAMCFAAELGRRGEYLDMSGMSVDNDILSDMEIDYFHYLGYMGYVHISGKEFTECPKVENIKYYMDMNIFTGKDDILVLDEKDYYRWSSKDMEEKYRDQSYEYNNLSLRGSFLIHMVAHLIIAEMYGELKKKPIKLEFDLLESKNTYLYMDLYSCLSTMDWLHEYIIMSVDFDSSNVDIEYNIFYSNSIKSKRHKPWSITEKAEFMKRFGLVEGSLVMLFTRVGMCTNNPVGKISSATIARIDEVCEDSIAVTTIALNRTKEEIRLDYNAIDEDRRYLFSDMLSSKPYTNAKILSLYELGIDSYMYDEYTFIVPINTRAKVTKLITIDGKEDYVEMSESDCIYWLMCQYDIGFDRELYRKMYSGGRDMLWDMYGSDSEV